MVTWVLTAPAGEKKIKNEDLGGKQQGKRHKNVRRYILSFFILLDSIPMSR